MNIGISDSQDSILFFTAKLDERARIIVPASIRRKLEISFGSLVFVGVEKAGAGTSQNSGGDADE